MHDMGTRQKRAVELTDHRSALLAERARILGETQNGLEILVLPGSLAVEDQAPLLHDQFIVLRQHRMDRQKLKLIDAALERIDRGDFGLCAECEEPIPAKRLNIVPWAAYCVPCQDRLDDNGNDETGDALEMTA
jgi:DnaK suppressor protein